MGQNRNWKRLQAAETEIKHMHALITIGATGAPTLSAVASVGIKSVVRASQGVYTVTMDQAAPILKHVNFLHVAPTAEDMTFQLVSETVKTNGVFQFRCLTAGVATDPASGDTLRLEVVIKNSSVRS